jgi:hypothetical protein
MSDLDYLAALHDELKDKLTEARTLIFELTLLARRLDHHGDAELPCVICEHVFDAHYEDCPMWGVEGRVLDCCTHVCDQRCLGGEHHALPSPCAKCASMSAREREEAT